MDERILQLKQLKKEYKKARRKAGWGFKLLAWIFGVVTCILCIITVFVLFNHTAPIIFLDDTVWEPLKAMVPLTIDYAAGWKLTEQWGVIAASAGVCVTALFALLGFVRSESVKRSEVYLNYRTIKLTLDTEKEERKL